MSAYSIATRGLAGRKIPQGVLAAINTLLFGASEPGAWYDPADLSTLFQDSAGTTPVTAVEQPVGRMLDKSGRGNHASQATSTKRPTYSRRVNLFTETEFRNGVSDVPSRSSLVTAASLSGYLGAIAFGYNGAIQYAYKQNYTVPANITHTISCIVLMDDGLPPTFSGIYNGAGFDFALAIGSIPITTGIKIDSLGGGFYKVTGSLSVGTQNVNSGVIKYAGNSTRTFKVTAWNLRLATDAHLPYQWVNTATDYDADPAKFPGYLRFDGVDDAMQTGNIDFTGTDKMTVWAGIHKTVDLTGIVFELDNNTDVAKPGALMLAAPYTNNPGYWVQQRGTIDRGGMRTLVPAAPSTDVVSVECRTSAPTLAERISIRVNGAKPTNDIFGGSNGVASNYANAPIYIGSRASTLLFFNGRLYGLIVRGAQSSLSQIEAAELYIRRRMMLP